MKICVIGNSHLASLKKGWEELASDHPSVTLTFWGAPGHELKTLARSGTSLVSASGQVRRMLAFTSGVGEAIEIPAYDVVLLYGLDLRVPFLPLDLSEQVRQLTCVDCLDASLNFKLAAWVRDISADVPVYIAPRPMGSFVGKSLLNTAHEPYGMVIQRLQGIAASASLRVHGQPPDTLVHDWCTQAHFAKDSVDLAGPRSTDVAKRRPQVDNYHMNGAFGRLWLQHFLQALQGQPEFAAAVSAPA